MSFAGRVLLTILVGMLPPASAFAQDSSAPSAAEDPRRSLGVSFGLLQPLVLRGGNVEADLRWDWFVLGYSHGWSLHVPASGEVKEQRLRSFVPFSTGFGVGVQHAFDSIGLILDLRAEPKYHRFELELEGDGGDVRRPLVEYDTITLGAGLYGTWLPFRTSSSAIRGIHIGASFRVWPRVWSSLEDDRLEYFNETTGRTEVHEALEIGVAGTPVIVNMAVGYLFPF